MMGWGRNQRDARDGVARAGYHLIHLEARQLPALTRLGTLRHLDLYLLGVDKIFRRHTEASRSHLLGFARQWYAVVCGMEARGVLSSLARIAARPQFVHRQRQRFVSLLADCPERDGTRHEMTHDLLHRLHLANIDGILPEAEKVAQANRIPFRVCLRRKLLEARVTTRACGKL